MDLMSSVAIMQPYIFPYIGYFNLIKSVDTFVFLDDVNYINKGWINRNKLGSKTEEVLFTIPLSGASQNKNINEIYLFDFDKWKNKFLKTFDFLYKKELNYSSVRKMLEEIFENVDKISELSQKSIILISKYLDIDCNFIKSSNIKTSLKKEDKLIFITNFLKSKNYHNSIGGQSLYDKRYFLDNGINLNFIQNIESIYDRNNGIWINNLSIIDMLVYCNKNQINKYLLNYRVI